MSKKHNPITEPQPAPIFQRWEYLQRDRPLQDHQASLEIHMRAYGNEGWELITIVQVPGNDGPFLRYHFKRPVA